MSYVEWLSKMDYCFAPEFVRSNFREIIRLHCFIDDKTYLPLLIVPLLDKVSEYIWNASSAQDKAEFAKIMFLNRTICLKPDSMIDADYKTKYITLTRYDTIYLNSLMDKNSLLKVFAISVEDNKSVDGMTKCLFSVSENFDVQECLDCVFNYEYLTVEELIINCLEVIRNDIKGN